MAKLLNIKMKKLVMILVLIFLAAYPITAFTATYYASPTGSGSTCSDASPCTVSGGVGKMASGDTLILKDGTYTGSANTIGDSSGKYPPSGTSAQRTVIKAANIGKAIIDSNYTSVPFDIWESPPNDVVNYLEVSGIHFRRGNNGVFRLGGSYNYVHDCGLEDGTPLSDTGQTALSVVGHGSYSLFEDIWVWGRGRYGFYSGSSGGGADHFVFRRVVVRLDSTPEGNYDGRAGLRFYYGNTNAAQNCIVIDNNTDTNANHETPYVFAIGGASSNGDVNHIFNGNIGLNNPSQVGFTTEKGMTSVTFSNNVLWDVGDGVFSNNATYLPFDFYVDHVTIGNTGGESAGNVFRQVQAATLRERVTNSVIKVATGITGWNGTFYSLTGNYVYNLGTVGTSTGVTSINSTQFNAALKYLPRTESGSAVGTAGASILYQIGGTGLKYGDVGFNTTTSTPLWPYANEQIWAAKMATYTASGPGGNRGFAALAASTTTPLTDYIWGYLGNPKPANIYGGTAPNPPQNPKATKQ